MTVELFIIASLLIVGGLATVLLLAMVFYGLRDSKDCGGNCKQGRRQCDCRNP